MNSTLWKWLLVAGGLYLGWRFLLKSAAGGRASPAAAARSARPSAPAMEV